MTIDNIKRLIAPDEHRELELKKTTGELKDGITKGFIKDVIKEQGLQLSDRQVEILLLINEDPTVTSQKLSERLSHKNSASARTIIKDTNYLQNIKVLKRIGGRKEGCWEIRLGFKEDAQ